MIPNQVVNFYGPDQADMLERNLKYMPSDWIYRNKQVSYKFNSSGLRMEKDLEDVNDNYILFSGTSFGMGLGILESDRYSNLVGSRLNFDFVNFCGPTYTNKIQAISFFNLLKNNFKLPKIVVIEYAPSHAYTIHEQGNFVMFYSKHMPENSIYQNYVNAYNKLLDSNFFEEESKIYRTMIRETCKQLNIKLIEISFNKDDPFINHESISVIDRDVGDNIDLKFARDIRIHQGEYTAHPGIGIHQTAADTIINLIHKN
jgi:hypothetical protein